MSQFLEDIGEQAVLDMIQELAEAQSAPLHPDLGHDDTAVLQPDFFSGQTVWTTDSQIENVHFKFYPALEGKSLDWLGERLFAVNRSDLTSKGANPRAAILSLGFPAKARALKIREFLRGLMGKLAASNVMLIGGDTHSSPVWSLNLTLIGELDPGLKPPVRSDAEPGQNIFITGYPGLSAAGLRKFQNLKVYTDDSDPAIRKHFTPNDLGAIGYQLTRELNGRLAMMDCSDGLLTDLGRMCATSSTSYDLNLPSNLLTDDVTLRDVLTGGEDYELLFATDASEEEVRRIVHAADPDYPVHRIGLLTSGDSHSIRIDGKEIDPADFESFEHFRKS